MKSKTLFGCLLLLAVLLATSCEEPFLDNYYGTKEHVYITPNVFDSTTSVRLVATWDVKGKARLSSSLIPRDTLSHQGGIFVDMPATEYDAKELSITPKNANVSTICISYDAQGRISQEALKLSLTFRFCCRNECRMSCGCSAPYKDGIVWRCPYGFGSCKPCCGLKALRYCIGPHLNPLVEHAIYLQSNGPVEIGSSGDGRAKQAD